ncbi:MAG: hypothetical protein KC910_37040, partial [Candidatus Eremiobacteraeota bacterium]|nr:hypothetical protein [Candidatus Eremiobacteraeota bacterium]
RVEVARKLGDEVGYLAAVLSRTGDGVPVEEAIEEYRQIAGLLEKDAPELDPYTRRRRLQEPFLQTYEQTNSWGRALMRQALTNGYDAIRVINAVPALREVLERLETVRVPTSKLEEALGQVNPQQDMKTELQTVLEVILLNHRLTPENDWDMEITDEEVVIGDIPLQRDS